MWVRRDANLQSHKLEEGYAKVEVGLGSTDEIPD